MKDAIRYTVKVTAMFERREMKPKDWRVIGANPDGSSLYGYTPEVETLVRNQSEVFEQTVDELDLSELVAVVNRIREPKFTPSQAWIESLMSPR